jgi:hypothetical protein
VFLVPTQFTTPLTVLLDEVAGYMRDIEITDDELDRVAGFGDEKLESQTLQIERKASVDA